MKKIFFTLFAAGVVSLLLSSCMMFSKNDSWSNPEFEERKLGKTVVIAVGDSAYLINQFETLLVSELARYGVAAQSSHQLWPTVDEMEQDQITSLVQSNHFDSIIVTRVLSEDDRQQMISTGYTASPSMGYAGGGYWGYGMSYSLSPNYALVSNSMTFELETNLFDVQSKKLVLSRRNEVYDGNSDVKNIQKVVKSVIKDLKRKKMF